MDNKTNLPKCPWCDFRDDNRERQKKHLIEKHRTELIKNLNEHNKPVNDFNIRWVAGEYAFVWFE